MNAINYLAVGAPMPPSIGRCADLYHDVRELRLAMEKEVAEIKAREDEIKEYMISNLSKSDDTGAAGLRYRVQIVTKTKYNIKPDGWGGFTSWMNKNNRFDFIQKRLNDKAVEEYIADTGGGSLPHYLDRVNVPTVSVTKIG